MAFFNYATMQMAAKIVYYGPGLCGKTTNLQYIYNKTSAKSRGEMVSLETESDRTLFFDLLPLEVGVIAGFKTRFQLYTVPGQVFYGETRRMVLKGVDGVVFVADSQRPMREANIESLKDLEKNLTDMGLTVQNIPLVLQFNKRDLPNLLTKEELEKDLNWHGWPMVESSAVNGMGVFDTPQDHQPLHAGQPQAQALEAGAGRGAPPHARRLPPESAPLPPPASPLRRTNLRRHPPRRRPPSPATPPLDVEFDTRQTKGSDKELATTAPEGQDGVGHGPPGRLRAGPHPGEPPGTAHRARSAQGQRPDAGPGRHQAGLAGPAGGAGDPPRGAPRTAQGP